MWVSKTSTGQAAALSGSGMARLYAAAATDSERSTWVLIACSIRLHASIDRHRTSSLYNSRCSSGPSVYYTKALSSRRIGESMADGTNDKPMTATKKKNRVLAIDDEPAMIEWLK